MSKVLAKPIAEIATYLAEGWTMTEGMPHTGQELAYMYSGAIQFAIATLMERGELAKTLPKAKAVVDDEPKGYL